MNANGRYAHIVGWGMYAPRRVLTNAELSQTVETGDEWIRSRTGIIERRIASPKETTLSLGLNAAREALEVARLNPSDLDLIIVATSSPEYQFPATACLLQDALGATRAGAFDLSVACSGFLYALGSAASMIVSGAYENALVVGAETLSRIVDWEDRNTCILFGDGAGAFVLRASSMRGGVLSYQLGSDGSGGHQLLVPAGGSRQPASHGTVDEKLHYIHMNGREVFRFATRVMGKAAEEVIEAAGLAIDDVDLFIPHQANMRIIRSAAKHLNLPMERVFVNLERYGNTSTASIPIAFCEALAEGRIKPGDNVVMVAFGAGLSWAAALMQWTPEDAQEAVGRVEHSFNWLRYRLPVLRSVLRRSYFYMDGLLGRAEDRFVNGKKPPHRNRGPRSK